MPDITLSIVTYNSEAFIRKVIDSIIEGLSPIDEWIGDLPDYLIIVVDNASTDGTAAAVKAAQQAYPGLIEWLPCTKNRGFGAGHNRSIPLMKSQYHVVVNPDIVVPRGALLDMASYMNAHPDVGLLTPKILFPDGRLQYLCKHATGCFMFFRTEVYLQIHGFDERFFLYLEDADITRRVNEVSKTVFHPEFHVVHEWQRDQHKKLSLMWVNVQSWMHYDRKWRRRARRAR